eukprot:3314184-Amphidinium_carterae.1
MHTGVARRKKGRLEEAKMDFDEALMPGHCSPVDLVHSNDVFLYVLQIHLSQLDTFEHPDCMNASPPSTTRAILRY